MEKLKRRRTTQRRFFTLSFKEADGIFKQEHISYEERQKVKAKVEILEAIIAEISDLDKQIESCWLDDETATEDEMNKDLDEAFAKLTHCKEQLKILKSKTTHTSDSDKVDKDNTSQKQQFSKLPKMNLPRFDGTLIKYQHFRERFDASVGNNPSISNVDKLDYLLGQLDGTAKDSVIGISCTESNYEIVLQILEENFGQPRKIIRAHVLNILNAPKAQYTASSLRQFHNQVMGDLRSLSTLQVPISECSAFIIPILEEKLPRQFREKMGDCNQKNRFNFDLFIREFNKQLQNLEESSNDKKCKLTSNMQISENSSTPISDTTISTTTAFVGTIKSPSCPFCKEFHKSVNCHLPIQERQRLVKEKKLCLNCLHYSHFVKDCTSKGTCFHCKQRHHTSLHGAEFYKRKAQSSSIKTQSAEQQSSASKTNTSIPAKTSLETTISCSSIASSLNTTDLEKVTSTNSSNDISEHNNLNKIVFVKTAQSSIEYHGKAAHANIFIDEGSQRSYITKGLAKHLGIIPHSKQDMIVNGFGGHSFRKVYDVASVGIVTQEGVQDIDVLITDKIVHPIDQSTWSQYISNSHIQEFQLADKYNQAEFHVDILIGVDQVWLFMSDHIVKSNGEGPTIQMSSLGALLSGSVKQSLHKRQNNSKSSHCCLQISSSIHQDKTYIHDVDCYNDNIWCDTVQSNLNEVNVIDNNVSVMEYQSKIEFRDGKYHVPLPWKPNHSELPSNLEICKKRLEQLKTRLNKLELMNSYCRVMQENLDKDYVEEVPVEEEPWSETKSHFLPHFFVLKDSETTPLRIVFAANTGITSLNDCLSTGPCLLNDLVKLLHIFRIRKFGLISDIARAFLSIKLLEPDRNYANSFGSRTMIQIKK